MSAKTGCFALLLGLFSFSAFAGIVETCHLSGKIVLTGDAEYVCNKKDLILDKTLDLVSNGHFVTIRTADPDSCIVDQGMHFHSFEGDVDALNGKDASELTFEAGCITGACASIHNDAYKNGSGGPIVYHVTVFDRYKCHDMTFAGAGSAGQGQDSEVVAFVSGNQRIPFSEFKTHVID